MVDEFNGQRILDKFAVCGVADQEILFVASLELVLIH